MDRATPNLPARDFSATSSFYGAIGFVEGWRDNGWMILKRGGLTLEFFPFPDLDPLSSSFGACLRVDDLGELYAACRAAGIPEQRGGQPRLNPPRREASGLTIAYMVDPDGSLIRMVQN
ncbi:bleomycin resistance protein [Sphingomonas sp. LY160]|uniref:bleomycin resistance protein n=1 Tax=Sphingomonas sp. LY160 TaxID=3095342 RepID=UPI002ADEED8E|nr:bleomycin resistance protein [Sphingomonas sp. LY160]MEA1072134.1 bleomycin resistance protein [Sphingomonas sp. LY160]